MGIFDRLDPYKRETAKNSFDVHVTPGQRVISATWNRSDGMNASAFSDLVFHTEPFPDGYEPRTTVLNLIDIQRNSWIEAHLIESHIKEEIH